MGIIARSAFRIACQRDNPRRKTTWPCLDLGDRQHRRAAQRLGCHQSVPPSHHRLTRSASEYGTRRRTRSGHADGQQFSPRESR